MNRLMRMISAAMLVMLLTAVFAIAGDEADTTQPGLELTRLPLSSPLIPLSSGVLTNVDASATNWRQVSARLFFH